MVAEFVVKTLIDFTNLSRLNARENFIRIIRRERNKSFNDVMNLKEMDFSDSIFRFTQHFHLPFSPNFGYYPLYVNFR